MDGENAESTIKVFADGSRLAYVATPCPSTGQLDLVVRDAGGRLVGRWPAASAGAGLGLDGVSLSPDGRRVAVGFTNQELILVGVRVLDVTRDRSIADGRLIKAPDPGCDLVVAEFQPRTGRLAAFERCVRTISGGIAKERFRLVYLDPGSGQLLSRGFAFDDPGNDLSVSNLDFDQTGRHLLYQVGSANPTDYGRPRPVTGTCAGAATGPSGSRTTGRSGPARTARASPTLPGRAVAADLLGLADERPQGLHVAAEPASGPGLDQDVAEGSGLVEQLPCSRRRRR